MNAEHAGFLELLAPASPDAGVGHFGLAERVDIRETRGGAFSNVVGSRG